MISNKKSLFILSLVVLAWAGLIPLLWAQQASAAQQVEIFAQGKRYDSVGEYREEEKNKNLGGRDDFLSKEKGDDVDPFARSYEAFDHVGFNAGVNRAVEDFTVGKDRLSQPEEVSAKNLEEVLKRSSEVYDGPLLLMSDHKKVKVMALEPLEGKVVRTTKMLVQ